MSELQVRKTTKLRASQSRSISASSTPATMQAVRLRADRGPAGLVLEEVKTPRPAAGEVLVRVHAAAVTRDELDWPVNRLPAIPSYEWSGEIAALGAGVSGLRVGQAVYALSPFSRDGAAAQYIATPAAVIAPKPANLSYAEAASLPLAALTAWQGLMVHGRLLAGQRVLIHGATGGVGHLAVQIARLQQAHLIGAVSHANFQKARSLGLDQVVDYEERPFETAVDEVDLVYDTIGGQRLERSPVVVRRGGRLVSVASEPSQDAARAHGITAVYFVVEPNGEQLAEITRLAESGKLRPAIDQVFPLAAARQAFERSLDRHPAGKIVIQVA